VSSRAVPRPTTGSLAVVGLGTARDDTLTTDPMTSVVESEPATRVSV